MVKSYKELLIWQKGMTLVTLVYRATADFPKAETYGLTDQMRRAAVSIPSNIAEGFGRRGRPEMARFTQISMGSLYELETQSIIAGNLGYLAPDTGQEISAMVSELDVMLQSFAFKMRQKKPTV